MERTHVFLLAILVVTGSLLGLRLLSPTSTQDLTAMSAGSGSVAGPNGLRDHKLAPGRVAMSSGERGEQKAPPDAPPPPGEERRGVRNGSSGSTSASSVSGGSANLVAGVERRRDLLAAARSRGVGAVDETAGELADPAMAGRTAAVNPAGGRAQNLPPADTNKRQTLEFVDDGKPASGDGVLLSLPFKGEIKPEVGGGPMSSDGLVSRGGEVEFTDGAQLSFPVGDNINNAAGTISFDVKPQWGGGDDTNNSLVQIRDEHTWENSLQIVKNYGNLRFIIHDSSGVEQNVGLEIPDWPPGESRRVDATWNNDPPVMALYVNGQLVGTAPLANPINFSPTTPMHIGSDFPNTSYAGAGGTISNFTVFGRALDQGEIARR